LTTDLAERTGLADELYVLLKSYPRDTWSSARSGLALFWIERHKQLRNASAALMTYNEDYREQRITAAGFVEAMAPRLQSFLSGLHGHHQIEDHNDFPSFRAAEPRLAPGFDVLATDHEVVDKGIHQVIESVNAFITTTSDDANADLDDQRVKADSYIAASETMHNRLVRHLDDEEDLIIPLIMHHDQ
jgi:iron-sulfur cluster repair protein YtfE (RIC family)